MITRGRVLLLETRLMLLIDNNEAELLKRQEYGTTGTEDNVVRLIGELFAPYLHTLRIAVFGMVDAEPRAKDTLQALRHLNGKRYLRQ